jgi:hypothetical protein
MISHNIKAALAAKSNNYLIMKYLISVLLLLTFRDSYALKPDKFAEPQLYGFYAPLSDLKKYADDIDRIGIRWIRVGGINDQGCLYAAEKGYHLVPVISLGKISMNNTVPIDQLPQTIIEWRQQVQKMVNRYGPNGTLWKENPQSKALPIRYWEIWNEPNIEFLNPPKEMSRVQLYAEVLKAASEEIRKLDPEAKIIAFNTSGGVSTGLPSPDGYAAQVQYFGWRRFIKETCQITGVSCFDAIGLHPYTMPLSPEAGGVVKGLELLKAVTTEQKSDNKQIWYTEVGYPIEYPRNKQVRDERQQACFTIRLYGISAAHGVTQLQNMYLEDIIYRQDNTRRSFGFLLEPGKWREQATALQTMIRLLPDPRKGARIIEENEKGICAYQFKGANGLPIIMAWNAGEGKVDHEFDLKGRKAALVNMLGKEGQILEVRKGKVKVSLTEAPVYIVPASKAVVDKLFNGIK